MNKAKKEIKTRAEFDERIRELVALVKQQAVVFPNDTADLQLARVKRAKGDPLYFFETYFPHYVTSPFADFHREEVDKIVEVLNSTEAVIMGEAWSRGYAKSSLFAIMLPIWAAVTKLSNFTIAVAADKELAMERTAAIRVELQYNARIRQDFPEMAMEEGSGEEHDFIVPNNVRMRAQGYKQGIRGKSHGPHRPRLIIIDDLESHKDTNPKIGVEKLKYVVEEAFGAFGSKGGVIVWLGNMTHSQHAISLFYERCKNETDNPGISFRKVIAEENGISNWKEAYPIAKLRQIEQVMGKHGYARHYLMKPGIDGDVFKDEWFRFVNPYALAQMQQENKINLGFEIKLPTHEELLAAPKITFTDPSMGEKETNDYKATITVAFWGGHYWIIDVKIQKCTIIEMLEYMYEVDKRYKTRQFMEDIFWQKLIREYLPAVAAKKGYTLPIAGHSPRLNKGERILALQPLFQYGSIFHCVQSKDWNLMKEQLLGFPNAGNDDGPDALAAAIEMFKHTAVERTYETLERGNEWKLY